VTSIVRQQVLYVILIFEVNRSMTEPPLYLVAHFLKILGGIAGGLVAERRRHRVIAVVAWASCSAAGDAA
jgi:hypothetical protein